MSLLLYWRGSSGSLLSLPWSCPVLLLTPQLHLLGCTHRLGEHLERGEENNLPISPSCSGRDGILDVAGPGILPRAVRSPEATPVGRGQGQGCFLPPWKITQSAALPTGCQADALLLSETSYLLRTTRTCQARSAEPALSSPSAGKSTGSVNKSLDSRSCPI